MLKCLSLGYIWLTLAKLQATDLMILVLLRLELTFSKVELIREMLAQKSSPISPTSTHLLRTTPGSRISQGCCTAPWCQIL